MRVGPKTTGPTPVALLFLLSLALATPVTAKKKEYLDGKILDADKKSYSSFSSKSDCHDGSPSGWSCDHVFLTIQVEDMTYVADYEQHRGLSGVGAYKFKDEDWPVNAGVELRFEVKHFLGLRRTFMFIKSPKGKEIKFVVLSKTGADGKEYCGNYRC